MRLMWGASADDDSWQGCNLIGLSSSDVSHGLTVSVGLLAGSFDSRTPKATWLRLLLIVTEVLFWRVTGDTMSLLSIARG